MIFIIIDSSSSFLQLRLQLGYQKTLTYTFQQDKGTNNSYLACAVAFLCEQAGIFPKDLELVIGSWGPGSFTGLRVGMAFIKGFVISLGIPFVFVNVLDALALPYFGIGSHVLSVIDGKKGRLYSCLYKSGERLSPYWDLSPENLSKELRNKKLDSLYLVGNYASSFQKSFPELRTSLPSNTLDTLQGLESLGLTQYKEKGSDPLGKNLFYLRESDVETSPYINKS